jgi:SAM-dependent methyltransferase
MPQGKVWEQEYRDSKLLHFNPEPQKDTLRFLKFLRRKCEFDLEGKRVLDLGSGTGRNANHMAKEGAQVTGIEISPTAVTIAKADAQKMRVKVNYLIKSFGETFSFPDATFDLIIDVTSSNSLNEAERAVYLNEINRTLKPGGYLFVKALCKEGDKNAKELIKKSPGHEKDTYYMKELGLTERVFDREDFTALYGHYFKLLELDKKESYSKMNNRSYKRHFWLGYFQK